MIEQAAIQKDGAVYVGRRHSNIIRDHPAGFFKRSTGAVSGFITDTGRFLDRRDAGLHAYCAGQIKKPVDCLMSEDLY